jgi:hypothetical protein
MTEGHAERAMRSGESRRDVAVTLKRCHGFKKQSAFRVDHFLPRVDNGIGLFRAQAAGAGWLDPESPWADFRPGVVGNGFIDRGTTGAA